MTDKLIGIPDEVVLSKIYMIREQKVMFDFDLAKLYNVENRALKQAVKRNLSRFPEEFISSFYFFICPIDPFGIYVSTHQS